ncbi:BTB-domain-containing protein, partial [Rhizophagus irregularis]
MVSKFYSSLSQDLSLILNDSDDCKVIIVVGKNQNIREFRAHSYILRARSPYFRSALLKKEFQSTFIASADGWITSSNNAIKFKKPNIDPAVFEIILRYMYMGEVDLTNTSGMNVLELLVASDELLLKELFKHVQDYLIEKQENWIQKNFVLVLHSVFGLESCKKLKDYCLKSICADPQPFFTSKNFSSLNKDILYGLLERNDLQIEEIVVWHSLIKWGIEQTPSLGIRNSDRNKWNNRNFEALKKTLNKFIPLIRFVGISPSEYFDKVRPYKAIIPNRIHEEIEEYYYKGNLPRTTTLPPRTGIIQKIESCIIKPNLSSIIINWIERKDS